MYKPIFLYSSKLNNFKNQKSKIFLLNFIVDHALPEDSTTTNDYDPLGWVYETEIQTLNTSNNLSRQNIGLRPNLIPTSSLDTSFNIPPLFGNSSDPYDNEKPPKCIIP